MYIKVIWVNWGIKTQMYFARSSLSFLFVYSYILQLITVCFQDRKMKTEIQCVQTTIVVLIKCY